jgi:midasin (ATPase involved in ribosome maturation)
MSEHPGAESNDWVSRSEVAKVLRASDWGVSWLIFSDDLEETYSPDHGFGITRESLQVYRHWLASSTKYERIVHRFINIAFAPIKFVLKLIEGADVPSPL